MRPGAVRDLDWRALLEAPTVAGHRGEENTMRGSGLIWTIVGILLAVALIIWIAGAL
ncbi:hypothetical protein [Kineococcus terrestris]|uniref:hypothetical protein n=1 Tax=Kineococcus terrestris TaxID=2044856 RepID=UPI0034DB2860